MSDFNTIHAKFMDQVRKHLLAQARENERTALRWYHNGMKGKLVKRNGIVSVEPCPPEEDGQLVLHVYPDGEAQ